MQCNKSNVEGMYRVRITPLVGALYHLKTLVFISHDLCSVALELEFQCVIHDQRECHKVKNETVDVLMLI